MKNSLTAALVLSLVCSVAGAKEPSHQARERRGVTLRVVGGLFTALGLGLAVAAPIVALAPRPKHDGYCGDSDACGLGALLEGGTIGGASSVALAIGIPLVAVGVDDRRKVEKAMLTSLRLQADGSHASIAIAARF